MKISVNKNMLMKLKQYKDDKVAWDERFKDAFRWNASDEFFQVDISMFRENELDVLSIEAAKSEGSKYKALFRKIKLFRDLQKDPVGTKVTKLQTLDEAAKAVIATLPNRWLFREESGGTVCPYFVSHISFEPADRKRETPAHVNFTLVYIYQRKKKNTYVRVHAEDIVGGLTVDQILKKKGYYFETTGLVEKYEADVSKYTEIHARTGSQYLARGSAEIVGSRYSYGSIMMERDGRPSKIVIDDMVDDDEEDIDDENVEIFTSNSFWDDYDENDNDDEADAKTTVVPPLHAYLKAFDLSKHQYILIHVNNLEPYKYDSTVEGKLILPQHKKDLIDILVQSSENLMEDIVKGKTGGIIVLATGLPGTGKTLTAEVYAETIKKPLYVVQCSQLGTDPEDLEKKLTEVLTRASRWGAILLIDEADVYIHERGSDITQNAIVGVFLRILEYYRGVLFLTSNRATIIDDAIISRCTAHIRYEIPTEVEAMLIWAVLSKQFKIELSGTCETYVEAFPRISGRTIKNLLKLSKLLADKKKEPVTLKTVEYAAKFLDGTVPS